jgi:hypothetical protein
MDLSGGAGINDEFWKIDLIHAKEAKYKRKRPNDSNETRFCLRRDDLDLRVTICHIREDRFRTGAHILVDSAISIVEQQSIATAKLEVD